ncbi:complement factor H-like isoform X3 [Sander lucioperca]|uniref:complement factor H-like isoform X3 n=1 Tax=Sander lucioperca TaxID=283035 RepID=UPI00125D1437|nr:complement factor H-like isoform X3 [Sander lucioperca]
MSVRYLGFVLLVWFPGGLHTQSADQQCPPPILAGGYLVPKQNTYSHEANFTYGCNNGLKPAVEGWWAIITCQNGKWSPKPQCIDEKACFPPHIHNAKYKKNSKGWYEDKKTVRITCDKGYEHKDRDATAICSNGTWSSVPVCEKSIEACGEPPKIPHAVIIHQEYQELFAADSVVQYECEDGYTVERGGTKENITCMSGNWTEGLTCSRGTRPEMGHGGDRGTSLGTRDGGGTSGSRTPPAGGVNNCGQQPIVPNGDVVGDDPMFLSYHCAALYQRVGPERVMCYSNGMWSEVPFCKATFCSVDTDRYLALVSVGVKIIKDGETERLECAHQTRWWTTHYSVARCTNGRMTLSRCCDLLDKWTVC